MVELDAGDKALGVRLSDDGDAFAVVGRVRVLDLDGNVISTALVRTSGVRMEIERIPDEP